MPHVITQSCCSDGSCVYACPVNCIHPSPDEPGFATAEMLYIDPDACVDCGACVSACPVGAIAPASKLEPVQLPFIELNASFYPKHEGKVPKGWPLVQTICDFVHDHITFGYEHANPTKTACRVLKDGQGVCRDFAHLAITLCRCMNVPARYCTGYLGDIGVPRDPAPMDFSGWFQVYLSGQWYTFDARHNHPRAGRILMGTGRDAADVALTTSFGRMDLVKFEVISDEVVPA